MLKTSKPVAGTPPGAQAAPHQVIKECEVGEIGSVFVVVNANSDHDLSCARVDVGHIGITAGSWKCREEALAETCTLADMTKEKCTLGNLPLCGCSITVMANEQAYLDDPQSRSALFRTLGQCLDEIEEPILCFPGMGVNVTDLWDIRQERGKESGDEDSQDENSVHTRSRSVSRSKCIMYDLPIPTNLIKELGAYVINDTKESSPSKESKVNADVLATTANVLEASTTHTNYGSVSLLLKEMQWNNKAEEITIVIFGLSASSYLMYKLLKESSGNKILISALDPSEYHNSKFGGISEDDKLPWVDTLTTPCHLMLLYSREIPVLDVDSIRSLECKAIITFVDNKLPDDNEAKEQAFMAFAEKNIFDLMGGSLVDVGAIAKTFAMVRGDDFTNDHAYDIGVNTMHKMIHLKNISKQYDCTNRKELFSTILGNETGNMHFGMWDGIDVRRAGSYALASNRLTEIMWKTASDICIAHKTKAKTIKYIDLGAGTGASARLICKNDSRVMATCLNISRQQNEENRRTSDEAGLGAQIHVQTGSFEKIPSKYAHQFDGCFSQDSFFHAHDKEQTFREAFGCTKGGGWMVFSDLMLGDVSDSNVEEEMKWFRETDAIAQWNSLQECIGMLKAAGWVNVNFVDYSPQISHSYKNMLERVKAQLEQLDESEKDGVEYTLLNRYRINLIRRIGQVDRGILKWGIMTSRKPYECLFLSVPPFPAKNNDLMSYSVAHQDGVLKFGTDVVIVTIKDKIDRQYVEELPKTVRLVVTMSAGTDHIDIQALADHNIQLAQAARDVITKSVADYLVSTIIFGLRNGFQNIGVPFPGSANWTLSWNSDGIDLDKAKIGFIGLGKISCKTAQQLRYLSGKVEFRYWSPPGIRDRGDVLNLRIMKTSLEDIVSSCDVVIPMCPLTPYTMNLVGYEQFKRMKPACIFINMARGKVVDTDGLTRAMSEGLIRHAILDTTQPEPLPSSHPLWNMKNVSILPHFATNTTHVRMELVDDIPRQIEDVLGGQALLRLEEQRLREELSDAHHLFKEMNMDELVWNHISAKLQDGSYLITPGAMMWDDIAPEHLKKNSDNITADIIHDAVYQCRPDVKAIVHLHTPATVAVSCLEEGFICLAQESAYFYNKVAYHKYEGISDDPTEADRIGAVVQDPNICCLLMENHGFCTFGKTVAEAWVLAYYFDKSCRTQLNCMATGGKLKIPDPKIMAHAAQQSFVPDFAPGAQEWDALRLMLRRKGF